MCRSRNPNDVDELIVSFEEQSEFIGEAFLELIRHRKRLKDGVIEQMKSLTRSNDIERIKAALGRADLFPAEEVRVNKDQLKSHLASLTDRIKKEINDLIESNDFNAIEVYITKRKGGGPGAIKI